jgi:hypothetical protein
VRFQGVSSDVDQETVAGPILIFLSSKKPLLAISHSLVSIGFFNRKFILQSITTDVRSGKQRERLRCTATTLSSAAACQILVRRHKRLAFRKKLRQKPRLQN